MGDQKLTTTALFRTIGKTERTRSAKADLVFRQLRKDKSLAENPKASFRPSQNISAVIKIASRQPV